MSCSFTFYHKNSFGFSRKCTHHNAVHVNFGNVSLLLGKQDISELSIYIAEALISEAHVDDPDDRCIYLPTRDYCLMFAMTYNELKRLSEILDHTLLMMQVDDALSEDRMI